MKDILYVGNIHRKITCLHKYADEDIKLIVRQAKLLNPSAIMKVALSFYEFFCTEYQTKHQTEQNISAKPRILLLHSPSSTFALRKRKRDHLSLVLEKIKDLSNMDKRIEIDICPNAFLIDIDKRDPQHHKNRQGRLHDTGARFKILYKFDENFILSVKRYSCVHIIDDVTTTGATLTTLQNLMNEYFREKIPVRALAYAH